MADIVIRGMKMPTNRDVTVRIDPAGEVYVYGTYPTLLLRAVALPEGHGRLIDADALADKMKKTPRYFDVKFDLDDAPTIVPAEGGSEDGN